MDTKIAGAGMAMALGMMLLLPTFNALNNSYVENVAPPPWIPPPKNIPDDFVPPEDWTPPPDWVPPEGWEPPPDWEPPEGWEPPPGYEGEIPPGGCPPPIWKWLPESGNVTGSMASQTAQGFRREIAFDVPKYTVGVSAAVNYTNWQAPRVASSLDPPNGTTLTNSTASDGGQFLFATQSTPKTNHVFQIIAKDEATMPPVGRYVFTLSADQPTRDGSYSTEIVIAIACGGMLQ